MLSLLELLIRTNFIAPGQFPPPSEIVRTLAGEVGGARLWSDLASTLAGWAIGLTLAFSLAVPLGIAIGSSRLLYRALRLPIEFLRPIPSVALLPLVVLVYGSGLESKVVLVTFASVWPLLIQTIYGIQDADPVATETARSFRLRRVERLVGVTLPGAVPYIVTGLRISSSMALILAVTTELLIGTNGLGSSIGLAEEGAAASLMYALVLFTGLIGLALNGVLTVVERRLLHWHASVRRMEGTA